MSKKKMLLRSALLSLGLSLLFVGCSTPGGNATESQVSTPTFSPAGGTFASNWSVTMSCATSGASIHYTTDNSAPCASSPTYTVPISVSGNATNETIKAIAIKTGMANSSVGMATYIISYIPWQTFGTQGGGTNQFNYPFGIAVDSNGLIYVADYENNRIVCMSDVTGTGWATFGSSGSGINQFNNPRGIAVDANGSIYVVDESNHRIVHFTMP